MLIIDTDLEAFVTLVIIDSGKLKDNAEFKTAFTELLSRHGNIGYYL